MQRTKSSNFEFLATQEPLLHEIAKSAEARLNEDSNATLVKLRQLAEQLARNAAAHLGISCTREAKFFDVMTSLRSKIDVDDKVLRLLHHLRKSGNQAVHEYKQDRGEAGKALHSARELCIWYYRTFCRPEPHFMPGPFIQPRDWKQEEEVQREEVNRFKSEIEERRKHSEHTDDLVRSLREQQERLRAIADERTQDAEASFELAEEQSKKLEALAAAYEERLADIARQQLGDASIAADLSERSKHASEHVQAEWAPEILLLDAFEDYELTANQESLVLELAAFLAAPDEHVFILAGHAGTGKTFITKGLSEYLEVTGRKCVLTAPTGKAARVVSQKSGRLATTIHKKIYSMDDIREYKVDELDGSETYKLYAEIEVNDDADNTVYIVDEASMVSDVYSEGEFFRFGSGRLLSDLMKYVNLDHNDHSKKVIFIGDAAQLPPVGMNFSPALDRRYLADRFGVVTARRFELSQVVRQEAGGGILFSANTLRDSIAARTFNKLSLTLDTPDVRRYNGVGDLVSAYLNASGNKVDDVAMIIAGSNADVASLNEQVRRQLFPDQDGVTRGDKLVVVMNCVVEGVALNNGDLVYVTHVEQASETRAVTIRNKNSSTGKVDETEVTLQFRGIQIAFRLGSGEVVRAGVKIFESLLYSNHPNLSSDETKALYIDFKRRSPHLPKSGKTLRDALRQDRDFNALRVKFGYALTCHKAQGSEWPDVFIQCETYMQQRTENYFRWLYTAITRASLRVHLLAPPSLEPWDSPRSVPVPGGTRASAKYFPAGAEAVSPQQPSASGPELPQSAPGEMGSIDIGGGADDPTLGAIYDAVSDELAGMPGVIIHSVEHHAWQEAYYILNAERSTRINITYNAKGVVGSIIPVPRDDFGTAIAARLAPIKGCQFARKVPFETQEVRFNRDVFNDFFAVFSKRAVLNGLRIVSVTEEPWNLRVTLANSITSGEAAIYCDGGGRISKYFWIGRPPQDQSLQQGLEVTMKTL